jgi:HEAT repeat protein
MKSIVCNLTRAAVVWALATACGIGGESDDRSTSALLAKLTSHDPETQARGLSDIGFGHDGVLSCLPALVDIATTSNSENRCKALKIIAETGPHAAGVSKQLYGLLRHESPRIRIAAADAVLSLESRNERAVAVLGAALKEPESELRTSAAEVLHWRGLAGKGAIPQLIAACNDRDGGRARRKFE